MMIPWSSSDSMDPSSLMSNVSIIFEAMVKFITTMMLLMMTLYDEDDGYNNVWSDDDNHDYVIEDSDYVIEDSGYVII